MHIVQAISLLLLVSLQLTCGMHVANWGVTSDIHRLKFVTRDFFQQSFKLISDDTYNLPDFKHTYDHVLNGKNSTVKFRAYNGRLHHFKLEMVNDTLNGSLRRLVISKENDRRHEMIVCDECIYMKADEIDYLYEAYYHKYSSHGKVNNGPILYWLSFQMTIIHSYDNQTNKSTCQVNFEPMTMMLDLKHKEYQIHPNIDNVGVLNFIVDKLDTWMVQQFNTTVSKSIEMNLLNYAQTTAERHKICDKFLSE